MEKHVTNIGGFGMVFLLCFSAAAQQSSVGRSLETIYRFPSGGEEGLQPDAALTVGDGVIYGTTKGGGAGKAPCNGVGGLHGCGTVFQLSPPPAAGGAWTETVLHSFTGAGDGDGAFPVASVVVGSDGLLYGTTLEGGADLTGTVFQLSPPLVAGEPWTETVLCSLWGAGGGTPYGGLALGPNGALYGTASSGGAVGPGAVFKLSPPPVAGGTWTETVIYSFTNENGDGSAPYAGVALGANGELYGTTERGGATTLGLVYELTPPAVAGTEWTETILHTFTGMNGDGQNPYTPVIVGQGGVLFGSTGGGGTVSAEYPNGCGTVFQLTPPAAPGGAWGENIIYSFTGAPDGCGPSSVVLGSGDVLYGTTNIGGTGTGCLIGEGCGVVFELVPPQIAGETWTENILYNFAAKNGHGAEPVAGVIVGSSGALFGTTSYDAGTAFLLTP